MDKLTNIVFFLDLALYSAIQGITNAVNAKISCVNNDDDAAEHNCVGYSFSSFFYLMAALFAFGGLFYLHREQIKNALFLFALITTAWAFGCQRVGDMITYCDGVDDDVLPEGSLDDVYQQSCDYGWAITMLSLLSGLIALWSIYTVLNKNFIMTVGIVFFSLVLYIAANMSVALRDSVNACNNDTDVAPFDDALFTSLETECDYNHVAGIVFGIGGGIVLIICLFLANMKKQTPKLRLILWFGVFVFFAFSLAGYGITSLMNVQVFFIFFSHLIFLVLQIRSIVRI